MSLQYERLMRAPAVTLTLPHPRAAYRSI